MDKNIIILFAMVTLVLMGVLLTEFCLKSADVRGVPSVLRMYNETILKCSDNECRRAVNVFYTQILRDVATEAEDGKN